MCLDPMSSHRIPLRDLRRGLAQRPTRVGPGRLELAFVALGALLGTMWMTGCGSENRLRDLEDVAVTERFREMHRRVYDLYRLGPERDAVHSLLADSFVGEALTREYVEHFTTLTQMQQEQIAIDVRSVDYESIELVERSPGEARIEAEWSVGGVVHHQAHRHPRINRYRAVYTLRPVGEAAGLDSLRIVDTRLRSLKRVRSAFDGAGGFPLDDLPESAGGLLSTQDLLESGLMDEILESQAEPPDADAEGPVEPPP